MGSVVTRVAEERHSAGTRGTAPAGESGIENLVASPAPGVVMCPCLLLGVVVSWKGSRSWFDRRGC